MAHGAEGNHQSIGAPFTAAVTSKSQLITFVKPNIYTKDNGFFLQGDWRFYIYSQPTYGLGTNAPDTMEFRQGSAGWVKAPGVTVCFSR